MCHLRQFPERLSLSKVKRRLLYPGLEAAGRKPPHRTLWAAAPGISQTGTSGTVQFPYPDREIMDIPCRPERAGGGTAGLNH